MPDPKKDSSVNQETETKISAIKAYLEKLRNTLTERESDLPDTATELLDTLIDFPAASAREN